MTSGTFAYPLCFSAMLAAIGLFVSNTKTVPATSAGELAAYAEIASLEKDSNLIGLREKCASFMALYPDSKYMGHIHVFQGLSLFRDARLAEAALLFGRAAEDLSESNMAESASYYLMMSRFLSNDYKATLTTCRDYLKRFPDGQYAGDVRYRLALIDFNNKEEDQSAKIIRDLSAFLNKHPEDLSNGSMYCLMADTYKRMGKQDEALASYNKALWTESPDDVIQYALESSINMLRARKDWGATAELRTEFLKRKPHSQIAINWMAEGERNEAYDILAAALKGNIADPAEEQAEDLICLFVKALVPRKKSEINSDELDKQLVENLNKIIAGQENATTTARVYYARGRLARLAKREELASLYLKGIATLNSKDPSPLSPLLLANSGDILLELGDIDGAERMFRRLKDHFPESKLVDAGPVGLGYVALARKKPGEALKIFEQALKKPDNVSFKEATLGKLEALIALGKHDKASQLALQLVGDKMFRGETASKCYLLLGQAYRGQAAAAAGADATKLLKKALGIYQRVYVAYQSFPDLCAEGYWQAAEVAKELGDEEQRQEILRELLDHPKLMHTERRKQAEKEM